MTKERIEKELVKVREQLAIMQAKEKDLEEQRKMAEDAEKMKFIEKNRISMEQLTLLNKLNEHEIAQLLRQKEEEELSEEIEREKRETLNYEKKEVIS